MRATSDFSQTAHLDRWDSSGDVTFVFGMGCSPTLHVLGDEIPAEAFRKLERRAKYQIKTSPRTKPKNVKEQVVIVNEYRNIRLQAEYVAEIDYQPTKCHKSYRLIVLRKDLSIETEPREGHREFSSCRSRFLVLPWGSWRSRHRTVKYADWIIRKSTNTMFLQHFCVGIHSEPEQNQSRTVKN